MGLEEELEKLRKAAERGDGDAIVSGVKKVLDEMTKEAQAGRLDFNRSYNALQSLMDAYNKMPKKKGGRNDKG